MCSNKTKIHERNTVIDAKYDLPDFTKCVNKDSISIIALK